MIFILRKKKSTTKLTSEIIKIKNKKRNTLIYFMGGFLKVKFQAKLKHEISHVKFFIVFIVDYIDNYYRGLFSFSMQTTMCYSQYS